MAFKTIIKFLIHKTDAKCNGESGIKSYHLKTIFLWACETIERKAWETSQGWANCFLFLITQLQICLEEMCLPSLFIPDCNLLEGSELSLSAIIVLIQEITSFKEDVIKYPKCNFMTIGPHKAPAIYTLGTTPITPAESVSDLGVTIDSKLKFKNHIRNIVSKANQRKSLTLRCFLSRNPSNLSRAFKIYTRPLLEYSSTIWSPSYVAEIILIESVQRDFTKRIPGCAHLSYPERLSVLRLQSLEHRRLIADLIMTFNIITGRNSIDPNFFFKINTGNLRGHPFKLSVPLTKTNTHKFVFASRGSPHMELPPHTPRHLT